MASKPELPIEVSDETLGSAVMALIRYLIALIVAVAVARGWLPADSAQGIGAILLAIGTTAYGIWNTWRRKAQLLRVANFVPNSIAKVK